MNGSVDRVRGTVKPIGANGVGGSPRETHQFRTYRGCPRGVGVLRGAATSSVVYAVGWGRLIEEACDKQGVPPQVLTLHSDRGAPMISKCTA